MVFHTVSSISGDLPHIEFTSDTYCSTSTCGGTGSQVVVSSRSEFGRFCSQLANARVALSDNSCRVLLAMAALLYLGHISAATYVSRGHTNNARAIGSTMSHKCIRRLVIRAMESCWSDTWLSVSHVCC